jgi:hypothetical protein
MPVILWSTNDWEAQSPDIAQEAIKDALEQIYRATTIQMRFDAFAELIQQCESAAQTSNNKTPYNTLKDQAIQFASAIVDAKDIEDLTSKFAARKEFSKVDPEYMPWRTPHTRLDVTQLTEKDKYPTAALQHAVRTAKLKSFNQINATDAAGDKVNEVEYLKTAEEREQYRILIAGGKFKKIELSPDEENLVLNNFDTKEYSTHGKDANTALMVFSPKGDIYAGSTDPEKFHHSSFLAGNASAFAGTLVVTNGNLQRFTDNSGHYEPPTAAMVKILTYLRPTGVLDPKPASEVWNDNFLRFEKINNSPDFELQSRGGIIVPGTRELFTKQTEMTLPQAVYEGNVAEVKRMLNAGADLTKADDDGRTPLALAALYNHPEIFAELLAKSTPEDLNKQDRYGMTPLLLAIGKDNTEIAVKLIESGANVNLTNSNFLAPLTLAVNNSNAVIAGSLLSHNVDTSIDNQRMMSFTMLKNNLEVISELTNPAHNIDFSNAVLEASNTGEMQPLLNILARLPASNNAFDQDALNTLENEASNLASQFVSYIEELPKEEQQKNVDMVLGKQNILGKVFDENSLMDTVKSRLERNGFGALVANFKEPEAIVAAASVPAREKGGTASMLAALQSHDAGIPSPKEIRTAPDYVPPTVAALSNEKNLDNVVEQVIRPVQIAVKR